MVKILIVDDEPRIRELIREHLEHAGYECEDASDGSAALVALQKGGQLVGHLLVDLRLRLAGRFHHRARVAGEGLQLIADRPFERQGHPVADRLGERRQGLGNLIRGASAVALIGGHHRPRSEV